MQELLKIQRLVRGNKKLFACLIGLQILYKPPLKYLRFGWGMARADEDVGNHDYKSLHDY